MKHSEVRVTCYFPKNMKDLPHLLCVCIAHVYSSPLFKYQTCTFIIRVRAEYYEIQMQM